MRPFAWQLPEVDEGAARALVEQAGLRPLTARILVARGLTAPERVARFLSPRLADLRLPDGIADLSRALDRLVAAIQVKERIGVFGDYDVDGVTTAAILASALRAFGADVVARVARRDAGYGLGVDDAARFADDGCRVLVTGDCGTSDHDALALCRDRGVDAIVIDHHQVPSGESAAFALINPHRPDDTFAFKGLASCGLAFYLAAALRSRLRDSAGAFDPRDLLDLVALGTIADLVPLVDENRILAATGLRVLGARKRPGVEALCEIARVPSGTVGTEDVSFRLAPRLNAAGRLGAAQRALDLLLAPDRASADQLAAELDDCNRERQRIQEAVWTAAQEACAGAESLPAMVVGGEGWHPGVVGIVAAKLVDRYARPAIVIGFSGGEGRGSARTVPGFNVHEALQACSEHLVRFGGHAGAAGLTVRQDKLEDFRRAFLAEAERRGAELRGMALRVDAVAELADLDIAAAEELARLAPFGAANAAPLVVLPGVTARSTRRVGERHLQMTLWHRGAYGEAIAFGMAESDPGSGASVDVVGCPEVDTYGGSRRARIRVKHLRRAPSEGADA